MEMRRAVENYSTLFGVEYFECRSTRVSGTALRNNVAAARKITHP